MRYTLVMDGFDPDRAKTIATVLTHDVLESSPRTATIIDFYGYAGWLNAADEDATRLLLSGSDVELRRGGFGPLMIPQLVPDRFANPRIAGDIKNTDMLIGTVKATEETIEAVCRLYGRGFSEMTIFDERGNELVYHHYNEHITFHLPEAAFERIASRLADDVRAGIL